VVIIKSADWVKKVLEDALVLYDLEWR